MASTLIAPGQDATNLPPGAVNGQVTTATPTGMITLPSIPNPTPPPPKTVAVVTPNIAQTDLAQKKDVAGQVATATQQQTQNILANAGQTGTPQQQTQNAQQQTQPTQTQQPTSTTVPANSTQQQILALINSGNVELTRDQVQTISGLDFTGFKMNPDGTFTADASALQRVNDKNGYNANTETTGDPTTDYMVQQLQKNQAEMDAASVTHQQQIQQILNGTFPLTADQQAQVADLQNQFQQLRTLQEQANANFTGATTVLGIRSGRSQYAPELAQAQITTAVNQGIQKLASLDSQASSAVAKLKQGFLDDDFKIINSAYQDLQDATQAKTQTLKDIQDVIKNHVEETTAKLNQQKAQLELDTAAINNIAQSALSASMKLDGTLDLDMIQQIADENGLDPNALYGAIQKAQKDEVIFQQGETKFASDQLQAAAQLDSTKQATSTAKANESLIRANIDKVKADTALVNGTGGVTTALASQPGYSKLTSAQKTIADGTNNLINALQAYKDLYKEKTDKSGGNYFGADAAELSSAYHSLIFQFSVAAGSGAIQKADAEQIEQIIPDPTSVSGITSAALKGGQKGGLKALETQIEKFSNNLKSYGLKPTDTSTPVPVVVPNPSGGEDIEITD